MLARLRRMRPAVFAVLTAAIVALIAVSLGVFWPHVREHFIEERLAERGSDAGWWPASWQREYEARRKLRFPVTIQFVHTPLAAVIDFMHDLTRLDITVDATAIAERCLALDSSVTIHVREISICNAVERILADLGLCYVIDDGKLLITDDERAGPRKRSYVDAAVEERAEQEIRRKLDEMVNLDFKDAPLTDVLEFLNDLTDLNIVPDRRVSTKDGGVPLETDVPIHLSYVPARVALDRLLRDLGLAYVIEHEMVLITTKERAAARETEARGRARQNRSARKKAAGAGRCPLPPLCFYGTAQRLLTWR